MPKTSSVIVAAQPGWYACLMGSKPGVPPDKRPIVAWLICDSSHADHIVWPITISENRNTCWGNDDSYFYVAPDGTYYSHESMGPYFDTEAEATAYAVKKVQEYDEHATARMKKAGLTLVTKPPASEPKRSDDETRTWQFTWMNGELRFQLLLKTLSDGKDDDPTAVECLPRLKHAEALAGGLRRRYDSDTVVDGTITSAGEWKYQVRSRERLGLMEEVRA